MKKQLNLFCLFLCNALFMAQAHEDTFIPASPGWPGVPSFPAGPCINKDTQVHYMNRQWQNDKWLLESCLCGSKVQCGTKLYVDPSATVQWLLNNLIVKRMTELAVYSCNFGNLYSCCCNMFCVLGRCSKKQWLKGPLRFVIFIIQLDGQSFKKQCIFRAALRCVRPMYTYGSVKLLFVQLCTNWDKNGPTFL